MRTATNTAVAAAVCLSFLVPPQVRCASQVKGCVTDTTGKPIEGATVKLYTAEFGYGLRGFGPGTQTSTDAKGGFELMTSSIPGIILVQKSGLAHSWAELHQPSADQIQVQLTKPEFIRGTVVDETGKAVSGALVYATRVAVSGAETGSVQRVYYLSGKFAHDCYSTRSDVDGRFQIGGFPTNAAVDLVALLPGKATPFYAGDAPSFDAMPYVAGADNVRLVVKPTGTIEGKIIAVDRSEPVPKAQLILHPSPFVNGDSAASMFFSDVTGRFVITNVPAGFYTLYPVFGTNAIPDWVASSVQVEVEPGRATRDLEIRATRGGILEISVVAGEGRKAEPGLHLVVHSPTFQHYTVTDDTGSKLVRVPPGEFQVIAFQYGVWSRNVPVMIEEGKTNRVAIEVPQPVRIAGMVLKPDSKPAPNVPVYALSARGLERQSKTDQAGRFEFEVVSPADEMSDDYCLLARDPENNLAVAMDFDDPPTNIVELALAPGVSLLGQVESQGKAVTNWTVELWIYLGQRSAHVDFAATKTAKPGQFVIPALPVGRRYVLAVSAPGCGRHLSSELTSEDPGQVELDPIELKPANMKIEGIVVDADDKPVPRARVTVYGENQPNVQARTDNNGHFLLDGVCDGQVNLSAMLERGGYTYGTAVAEAGSTNVVIRLGGNLSPEARTQQLTGVVTDPEGNPVEEAQVGVYPSETRRTAKTNSDGIYNLSFSIDRWRLDLGVTPRLIVVHHDRNLAAALEIEEGTTNLNVQLKPAVKLVGRVENESGKPVPNPQVGIWFRTGPGSDPLNEPTISVRTNGSFEVTGLPREIQIMLLVTAPGHGAETRDIDVGDETNSVSLEPFVLKTADKLVAGQVVDENDKPVRNAYVRLSGTSQPSSMATTDNDGRFQLKACEGPVQLFVTAMNRHGSENAEAGDTNIVIHIRPYATLSEPSQRASLKGKPRPDLTSVGISMDAVPPGRPLVICLFDLEQRPSRRSIRLLNGQYESLKAGGVGVIAVQTTPVSDQAFEEWKRSSEVSFPIGRVPDETAKVEWAKVRSLPFLILVDSGGKVVAEGFALEELEAKLAELKK